MEEQSKEYKAFLANIRELAKTRYGKEFIWFILDACDLFADSFTGNSQTYYLLGKKAVGYEVLSVLEDADATIYPRLLLEKTKQNEAKDG